MAAVGGMCVSKRSKRAEDGDGAEHKTAAGQPQTRTTTTTLKSGEAQAKTEPMERRSSCCSVTGSETSASSSGGRISSDRSETEQQLLDPNDSRSWEDVQLLLKDPAKAATVVASALQYDQPAQNHDQENLALPLEPLAGLALTGRPSNFGVVVPGVYRCGFPQAEDYAFIQGLGLKSVVTLVQKEFPEGYRPFLDDNGIKHHVFNMKGTKKEEIPIRTMRAILSLILDSKNYPLLIHCNHGKHRTGCVVGIVRKVSGWELSSILDEYKSFATPKERECDIQYITDFNLTGISNVFARRSRLSPQRSFFRATVFTIAVLVIWMVSSPGLQWRGEGSRRRFGLHR